MSNSESKKKEVDNPAFLDGEKVALSDIDLTQAVDITEMQHRIPRFITIKQEERLQYVIDRAKRSNQPAEAINPSDTKSSGRNRKAKRVTDSDSADAG